MLTPTELIVLLHVYHTGNYPPQFEREFLKLTVDKLIDRESVSLTKIGSRYIRIVLATPIDFTEFEVVHV